MKAFFLAVLGSAALVAMIAFETKPVRAATLLPADEAARVVVVRNVKVQGDMVSGELVNNSGRLIRDVQLLIRQTWVWKNEFRPGTDDFGSAVYYTVEKEIPAGATVPFTYQAPSPLPSRPDGHIETAVTVAGFTEVIR